MIGTLIGKIGEFLRKDFLFASFLPALLFLTSIVGTLAGVIGLPMIWEWLDGMNALQKAMLPLALVVVTIVLGYLLQALRPSFVRFWSGMTHFPLWNGFFEILRTSKRRQYLRQRALSEQGSPWSALERWFRNTITWDPTRPPATSQAVCDLLGRVQTLDSEDGPDEIKMLLQPVIDAFARYSGESLRDVFHAVFLLIREWDQRALSAQQTALARLDQDYGSIEIMRATDLGNVIESYNAYSAKRYNIEAELFWPRLQHVIPKEYREIVDEPRILLDFALTMATLSATYALIFSFVGPWLWFAPRLWASLILVALSSAFFFYRVAVGAAIQFGHLIRSCFDLFRLDLMKGLWRPHPDSFEQERNQWQELSQLAVYGDIVDFAVRPAK